MLLFIINAQMCVSDTLRWVLINFLPKMECHLYAYDYTQTHWNRTAGVSTSVTWLLTFLGLKKKKKHLLCMQVHVNVSILFVCGGLFCVCVCNTCMPCSCWFIVGCHIKCKKSHHSLLCVCVCVHACVFLCVCVLFLWSCSYWSI